MLQEILATADERAIEAERRIDEHRSAARSRPRSRDLIEALRAPGLSVIAEIKRRSPSAGDIDIGLDPAAQAMAYEAGGAAAISVLTEPHFFAGSLDDLEEVASAVDIPVLRKDFTRNEAQVWEARAFGADAILLIVAALDQDRLERLVACADEVGVAAIVEAHSVGEVDRAVAAGAAVVGVNNRNLTTFVTDLSVAERAAHALPDGVVTIGESGVSSIEGAARMRSAGYDAILVGEALVRHPDPAAFVAQLRAV